jgi:hypothetical protein
MAADAGAQQILDLLNQPSDRLQADAIALAKAGKKAPHKAYGVMPQTGIDALADMRAFYRDLRSQIDAIQTSDTASKASALAGLDQLDRYFGSYERALELGYSAPAVPKLNKAVDKGKDAKKTLRAAVKGLSQ